eukprot:5745129-Amphidinium_carterae.1
MAEPKRKTDHIMPHRGLRMLSLQSSHWRPTSSKYTASASCATYPPKCRAFSSEIAALHQAIPRLDICV